MSISFAGLVLVVLIWQAALGDATVIAAEVPGCRDHRSQIVAGRITWDFTTSAENEAAARFALFDGHPTCIADLFGRSSEHHAGGVNVALEADLSPGFRL